MTKQYIVWDDDHTLVLKHDFPWKGFGDCNLPPNTFEEMVKIFRLKFVVPQIVKHIQRVKRSHFHWQLKRAKKNILINKKQKKIKQWPVEMCYQIKLMENTYNHRINFINCVIDLFRMRRY